MKASLRKKLDQRAALWSQYQDARSRAEKDGAPNAEDGETRGKLLDDIERLSQEIEEEERSERVERLFEGSDPGEQRGTNPRGGVDEDGEERAKPDEEYRSAFDLYVRRGLGRLDARQQQLLEGRFEQLDTRAQGVGTDAAGGYAVPKEFVARLVEVAKAFGGILAVADVIPTDTGAPMNWPTEDDTSNMGAILSENTQVTEQDATLGQASLGAYTYTSKMIRASLQFLQDAGIDVEAWLARKVGTRIARALAVHLATGSGTGQPQGLMTGLSVGATAAGAAVISFDDLIELEHSVDPAYRMNGRYVLADAAIKALRKAKDGNQNYIWQPSTQAGVPSLLNGRPYTIDNGIAAPAASARTVAFGDIREAYVVRQVRGAQVMRLTERYADYLQVGFLGFQRWDAKVQNAAAAKVLVQAAS
ncbi:phage major capsid protein [Blastococcus sp. CCUG 61487]|uniref:phage major capsid protein n=1 Tax=Blastococcus sp. CCUG 61487 TaxID=1840703 RepID=UPI0010C0CF7A|nr:phage major capsid protein [Blastococcus sp. CCUG 61487]TKJ24359.1 hypothetical protein A6V29_05010 [Blastococcus sp. CCUG 61487]